MAIRLLHTSDWHLGQSLGQQSRDPEHRLFLDWLAETIRTREVDVLLVSGDIFHTQAPSAESQALYYRFLARLMADNTGVQVILTGGNHDSAARLNAPSELLKALGVRVFGGYDRAHEADLLVPVCKRGTSTPIAMVAAVPFVHEWFVCGARLDEDPAALSRGFQELYTRLADVAETQNQGLPLVGMGHMTVYPASRAGKRDEIDRGDTPQDIHRVGFLGAMAPSIFDPRYRYVALGHIHQPIQPDPGRVMYSGSPVPVSFTEPISNRRCIQVDLDAAGGVTLDTLPVPAARRLQVLRGDRSSVEAAARTLTWSEPLPPFVFVDFEEQGATHGNNGDTSELFKHCKSDERPIIVESRLRVMTEASQTVSAAVEEAKASFTVESVFRLGWQARFGDEPVPEDLMSLFHELASQSGDDGTRSGGDA
jgi:exonuclease SbcD